MSDVAEAGSAIRLAYGRGALRVVTPVAADILRPHHATPVPNPAAAVAASLRLPAVGPPLVEMVPRGANTWIERTRFCSALSVNSTPWMICSCHNLAARTTKMITIGT